MLAFIVVLAVEFTVSIKVMAESHPFLLVRCIVYVPPVVYVVPLKVIELPVQTVSLTVLVLVAFTVSVKVTAESHPTLFVKCAVYVPADVYVLPLKLYD